MSTAEDILWTLAEYADRRAVGATLLRSPLRRGFASLPTVVQRTKVGDSPHRTRHPMVRDWMAIEVSGGLGLSPRWQVELGQVLFPLLLAVWMLTGVSLASAQVFTNVMELGARGDHVSLADFDGDGDLDILSLGDAFAEIRRNDGAGVFTPIDLAAQDGRFAGRTIGAWGDVDNDGRLDLAVGNDASTVVFRNVGGGQFTALPAILPGSSSGLVWGDFDQDGDSDLLLSAPGGEAIFRNDGGGALALAADLGGLNARRAHWGDYDGDGDLDTCVAHAFGIWIDWYDGGRRSSGQSLDVGNVSVGTTVWADVDCDGDLDLWVAGVEANPPFASPTILFRNDGMRQFAWLHHGWSYDRLWAAQFADLDADGLPDLVKSAEGASLLYRNAGDATFTEPLGEGVGGPQVALGDLDRDGDVDLVTPGPADADPLTTVLRWVRNDTGTGEPPPGTAAGVTATELGLTSRGHQIQLSWLPSIDPNQPTGLTYNVRVGTSTNEVGILSSLSVSGSGARLVPVAGNAGSRTNLTLFLAPGEYQCAVQAVDQSFRASAFTASVAITVGDGVPGLETFEVWATQDGTAELAGRACANGHASTAWFEFGADTNQPAISPAYLLTPARGGMLMNHGLTNLPRSVRYFFRLVATNAVGRSETEWRSFTTPNDPPELGGLRALEVGPAELPALLAFTVADRETPAENLRLSARSSATNFLPNEAIRWAGTGTNRTLELTPQAGVFGTTVVTLTVLDEMDAPAGSQFQFSVVRLVGTSVSAQRGTSWDLAAGDLNNDGLLDAYDGMMGRVLTNLGGLAFGASRSGSAGVESRPAAAAIGDMNLDGWLDIFQSASTNPPWAQLSAFFLVNQGGTRFSGLSLPGMPDVGYGAAAWGDYDNDGDPDLLVTGEIDPNLPRAVSYVTRLYRNDRARGFTLVQAPFPALTDSAAAWGDYDNDGDLDLALSGVNTNGGRVTRLYRNDGVPGFTEAPVSLGGVDHGKLQWGDFDNDGDLDLAVSGNRAATEPREVTRVYRNDGGDTFTNMGWSLSATAGGALAWGDLDGDGYLDLAVGTPWVALPQTGVPGLYLNQGGTNLSGVPQRLDYAWSLVWADFDGDGDLDLLMGGWDGLPTVYRNALGYSNAPPAAPGGLSATVRGGEVLLEWTPATDPNQSGGLSYNIRVGSAPGRDDVVVAMADPGTGQRRVAQIGNAGLTTRWPLRQVRVGTYYWSVQATDHGYAGGPFAPESSFTVLTAPALVEGQLGEITSTSAGFSVVVEPNGQPSRVYIEYGPTTAYGAAYPVRLLAGDAGETVLTTLLPDLEASTDYHARVVVSNAVGQVTTGDFSFRTLAWTAFSPLMSTLPQVGLALVAWGDFDNDQDLDMAQVVPNGWNTNVGLRLLRNDGAGIFTPLDVGLPQLRYVSVRWSDLDTDGNLDLLLGSSTAGAPATVLQGDGAGGFTERQYAPMTGPASLGDYDQDGDLDASTPSLRRNNGRFASEWQALTNVEFSAYHGSAQWLDFDNDGRLDLAWSTNAIAGQGRGIWLAAGDGRGQFQVLGPPFTNAYDVATSWQDYDGDGRLDALLADSRSSTNHPLLYLNGGAGTFTDASSTLAAITGSLLDWDDLDNDGLLDALTLVGTNIHLWTRPDGSTYVDTATALTLPAANGTLSLTTADVDGDGRLDLYLTGEVRTTTNRVNRLFRNNTALRDRPPTAPGGLFAQVDADAVVLRWVAAQDPDQDGGLTYNVRVGRMPGGQDVVSALSDPLTGFRRVVAQGNAGLAQLHSLRGLWPGTYYWSVQAVDRSAVGGPFAPEASFVVETTPALRFDRDAATPYAPPSVRSSLPGWVTLEASPDLRDWTSNAVFHVDADPRQLDIPLISDPPTVFYRARLDPR